MRVNRCSQHRNLFRWMVSLSEWVFWSKIQSERGKFMTSSLNLKGSSWLQMRDCLGTQLRLDEGGLTLVCNCKCLCAVKLCWKQERFFPRKQWSLLVRTRETWRCYVYFHSNLLVFQCKSEPSLLTLPPKREER